MSKVMNVVALILLTAGFMVGPVQAQAQQSARDICSKAKIDAKNDVSMAMWIESGFVLGGLGVIAAYASKPSPPAYRLIGKDQDYVFIYTECYRNAGRDAQVEYSAIWCVAVSIFYLIK